MAQTDVVRLRSSGVAAARKSALINLLIDVRQKKMGTAENANKCLSDPLVMNRV